jgi:hypothetical protein
MSGAAPVVQDPAVDTEVSWPFFEAGGQPQPGGGLPLGIISGGLILDSGEAERTFIFRCQDRYLAYNTLQGLRSVLFVSNDEHVRYYREALAGFQRSWEAIAAASGVLPPSGPPEPVFIACDIDRVQLGACWALLDQLRRGILERGPLPPLYLNQISPTYARLLGQLDQLLRDHGASGGYGVEACERLGSLALQLHNKAHYVDRVRAHQGGGLPPHVPTAVAAPERFLELRRWEELVALYREETGEGEPASLFVKSSLDSGGNVAARLTRDTFDVRAGALRHEIEQHILGRGIDWSSRVRELRGEVDAAPTLKPLALTDDRLLRYKRLQAQQRVGIRLLIQREVLPPASLQGRFAGLGLSWQVEGPGRSTPIAISAQLYKDAERKHFLGSYVSPELARSVLQQPLAGQMRQLCDLFAHQGWRGPLSFDARLNAEGVYELIYDCNPRLTAVFPSLAVRTGLRRQGLEVKEVLGLGYRGEFVWKDLPGRLAELASRGLLYTRERQRGAVVLPNLSRRSGFDVALVNVSVAEARHMLATGAFSEEGGTTSVPQVYD